MYTPRNNRKPPIIPKDSLESWAKMLDDFTKLSVLGVVAIVKTMLSDGIVQIDTVVFLLVIIFTTFITSLFVRKFIQRYYKE